MCDNDPASLDFFNKHLELMRNLRQHAKYKMAKSIDDFFDAE